MLNILFISYHFPPIGGMSPLRVAYFVRYLALKGYNIDVLTINSERGHPIYHLDEENLKLIPSTVRVFRTYPGFIHHLSSFSYRGFKKLAIKKEYKNKGHDNNSEIKKVWNNIKALKPILKPFLIPDSKCDWLLWGLRKGFSLLKKNKYDLIISFGYPFTSHAIAYILKKHFNIPWIADYGDPWAFNPDSTELPYWRRVIDRKLEAKFLKQIDNIIVTTEETMQGYLDFYSFLTKEKLSVISCGYDGKQFNNIAPVVSNKFRITYTGIFIDGIREPYNFFQALKSLQNEFDFEVIIAGNIDSKYKDYIANLGLNNIVRFIGFQPHNRIIALQKGSSVLVVFGWIGGYQVPAKLLEYFAACRPILVIQYDEKDISSKLVNRYNRGLCVNNNLEEIRTAIRKLHSIWKQDKINDYFTLKEISDFSWDHLANKLEEIICNVCNL